MSTFRAYLITPAAELGMPREWDTVRERAKARARELGGASEEVEVPATKAELIPFLNGLEKRLSAPLAREEAVEAPTVAPAPVAAPSAPEKLVPTVADINGRWGGRPAPKPEDGATALIDWVFDTATPTQIADIFNGLSARFTETIRPRRAA